MKRRSSINSEEQVTCKTWRNVDTSGHGSQAFISAVEKFNENTFARADIWQQMTGAVLAADWLTMRRRNVQLGRPTKSNRTAKVAQHTQTHGHTLTKESMDQASSGSGPARRRDARSDDSRSFSLSLSLHRTPTHGRDRLSDRPLPSDSLVDDVSLEGRVEQHVASWRNPRVTEEKKRRT